MDYYRRYGGNWILRMPVYADRTELEGQVADFVDCAFRPGMSIDRLRNVVMDYIQTLSAKDQAYFHVIKFQESTMTSEEGFWEWIRVRVIYKDREVISIRFVIETLNPTLKPC